MSLKELLAAANNLDEETWEKVDKIARIISPGAFPEEVSRYINEPARARQLRISRIEYEQSVAKRKAWEILVLLGIVPDTYGWTTVFNFLQEEKNE